MAAAMFNDTVHVCFAGSADVESVTEQCECFGDIFSVNMVDGEGNGAVVVFFDVRAAARALTSGYAFSLPVPNVLTRTVRLQGSAQLHSDELELVSNVTNDVVDASIYIVDFYDSRDAAKLQEKQPTQTTSHDAAAESDCLPGLEAPPGLDVELIEGPPGFGPEPVACTFQVRIRGLPNAMLSESMMEAMLHQAGLEPTLISFTTTKGVKGVQHGAAMVTLSTLLAVQGCIRHFHGRNWDASGDGVKAELVSPKQASARPAQSAAPAKVAQKKVVTQKNNFAMSATASVFVPSFAAAAPAGAANRISKRHIQTPCSDASTDIDSASEEEKLTN